MSRGDRPLIDSFLETVMVNILYFMCTFIKNIPGNCGWDRHEYDVIITFRLLRATKSLGKYDELFYPGHIKQFGA